MTNTAIRPVSLPPPSSSSSSSASSLSFSLSLSRIFSVSVSLWLTSLLITYSILRSLAHLYLYFITYLFIHLPSYSLHRLWIRYYYYVSRLFVLFSAFRSALALIWKIARQRTKRSKHTPNAVSDVRKPHRPAPYALPVDKSLAVPLSPAASAAVSLPVSSVSSFASPFSHSHSKPDKQRYYVFVNGFVIERSISPSDVGTSLFASHSIAAIPHQIQQLTQNNYNSEREDETEPHDGHIDH